MRFTTRAQVRFADVDPAAIVFFPRYFEMLNAAVEDWFAAIGSDFRTLHVEHRIAVATVNLQCDFVSPSRLGDVLTIHIEPIRVGRSSCSYSFAFSGEDRERLRGAAVLVCVDMAAQASMPWPVALGSALKASAVTPNQPK